jgi:mono/diheme cytochrome c family protein
MKKKLMLAPLLMVSLFVAGPLYADHNKSHVNVEVGDLSANASKGQVVFNSNCASCHGVNAAGGIGGPPLIHTLYNPGHHSNKSFVSAVRNGVNQHHWKFGNMPPQRQVAFGDMVYLMKFIREVQEQNGIKNKAHTM